MDAEEMRAFQFREENDYLPDEQYVPTEEDRDGDPEIRAMVEGQYAQTNADRREQRARDRVSALESLLEAHGIDVPDDL